MNKELQANSEENRTIIYAWRQMGLPVEWRFHGRKGWTKDTTHPKTIIAPVNFSLWYRIKESHET